MWNISARWRHDIETLSVLASLLEGNPPVTGGFPHKKSVIRNFVALFGVCLSKLLNQPSSCWSFDTPWRSCDVTVLNHKDLYEPPKPNWCYTLLISDNRHRLCNTAVKIYSIYTQNMETHLNHLAIGKKSSPQILFFVQEIKGYL